MRELLRFNAWLLQGMCSVKPNDWRFGQFLEDIYNELFKQIPARTACVEGGTGLNARPAEEGRKGNYFENYCLLQMGS